MKYLFNFTVTSSYCKTSPVSTSLYCHLSRILKTSIKAYEAMFFDMYVYYIYLSYIGIYIVYTESVFNTLYIEIKHKC